MNHRLPSLDGLRGMAALFVLFSHLSSAGLVPYSSLNLSGSGKYGVFLFFVLSAFLLSAQFFQRSPRRLYDRRLWLRYAVRRVLRIFPLFIVVVAFSAVLTMIFKADFVIPLSWDEALRHLALLQGKSIYWTVPVEFKYYMVLPAVVFLMHGVLKDHVGKCIVLVLIAIAAVEWHWPAAESVLNEIALGPYLSIFFMGSLAALLHIRLLESKGIRDDRLRWVLEVVAFLTFAAVLVTVPRWWSALTGEDTMYDHFHRHYILYGLLWSVFILTHLHGRGVLRWVLSSAPMRLIGTISFSIYLWHLPVIRLVKEHLGMTAGGKTAIILAVTFVISMISYAMIERPFLRMWRRKRV